jgi:hypothetical protein
MYSGGQACRFVLLIMAMCGVGVFPTAARCRSLYLFVRAIGLFVAPVHDLCCSAAHLALPPLCLTRGVPLEAFCGLSITAMALSRASITLWLWPLSLPHRRILASPAPHCAAATLARRFGRAGCGDDVKLLFTTRCGGKRLLMATQCFGRMVFLFKGCGRWYCQYGITHTHTLNHAFST